MWYRIGADFILLLHLIFVIFVMAGGLLVLKWPRLAWWHLPAVAWGATVEFTGWMCPLTPLETVLRSWGGSTTYDTGFIEHYLLPLLYPAQLTRDVEVVLGAIVIALNVVVYGWLWRRSREGRPSTPS